METKKQAENTIFFLGIVKVLI